MPKMTGLAFLFSHGGMNKLLFKLSLFFLMACQTGFWCKALSRSLLRRAAGSDQDYYCNQQCTPDYETFISHAHFLFPEYL
jgi:hypothetical protein